MASSSDLIFNTFRREQERVVDVLARRYDFPNIRLLGQAVGIEVAYFVGEKMTRFEMAESLIQVADRKGLLGSLVEELVQPTRNGGPEIRAILGIDQSVVKTSSKVALKELNVFLSHSSIDKPFVRQLRDRLESNAYKCWVDEVEIKVGFSIRRKIEEGIVQSGYFVIVLTPDSVASEWVQRELDVALLREIRERNVFVLPVLLRDCNIPPMLQVKKYADFRTSFDAGYTELIDALK